MNPMKRIFSIILITHLGVWLSCVTYKPFYRFEEQDKYVLLTFDDGPNDHNHTTQRILDVLKKQNVKALFNVIGANVVSYPDIVRRIHQDGHILANHGHSPYPVLFRSRQIIANELDSCTLALRHALKDSLFNPLYFRPAFGWFNPRTLKLSKKRNMKFNYLTVFLVDTHRTGKDSKRLIKRCINKIEKHRGGIIVLHDGMATHTWLSRRLHQGWDNYDRGFIPEVTDSIITILKRKGFRFPALQDQPCNNLSEKELTIFKDLIY